MKLRLQRRGGAEVVSLGVRRSADLRPTFLQVNDIADFGTLADVAALLVPPGAALLASSEASFTTPGAPSDDTEPVPRSYFTYEFRRGRLSGVLVAAAKRGKVRARGCVRALCASVCRALLLRRHRVLTRGSLARSLRRRTSCWPPRRRRSRTRRRWRACAR